MLADRVVIPEDRKENSSTGSVDKGRDFARAGCILRRYSTDKHVAHDQNGGEEPTGQGFHRNSGMDWVSADIRTRRLLTIATYQALHALWSGRLERE